MTNKKADQQEKEFIMTKILRSFYLRPDVVKISRELLGKYLFTKSNGQVTGGMIVETEAYAGCEDRASHAFNNRRTKRTETLYQKGGIAYVYLVYGMYPLFNIVTNSKDIPHAVLIRSVEPVVGLDIMHARRTRNKKQSNLTNGPGKLCQALGITVDMNGIELDENQIWLEDRGKRIDPESIISTTRIGIDYAGPDANLPYRFYIKDNTWASHIK
jgi:DNA-3-methyladenine glycosylase